MKAVLVGPIQQENLALGYLAGYARKKGHDVDIVAYAYRKDIDRAIAAVLDAKPDLVGLGIAFQNNIDDYVLLMRALRERGYRGHLTCGGHVGTFCWEELLEELPELDSVVRHDGEETLVEMLDALERGERPRGMAGLVWREDSASPEGGSRTSLRAKSFDGQIVKGPVRAASMALDAIPPPERSPEPYTVGGIIVDFLITARGCVGECSYCSIAAYTSEQKKSYRLRKPEAVADEIAQQYHQRGARVFFVQDDLFILPGERAAIERMARIRQAVHERGVRDSVFWIKGRPENITPAVAAAAREMGGIHMFLGVENASGKRLKYLGRTHLPIHNHSAIANLRAANVMPSFNFMLFDPDCSIDDVTCTLDMAAEHPDLPWNVCRTEIYSGTALRKRLGDEGRLMGNWRSWGYRMRDERAELMFRIFRVSFFERALAIESLLNRLISLSFARQLHVELLPSSASDAIDRAVTDLGVAVRRDTVERLRQLVAFVSDPPRDPKIVQRYAVNQALAIGAFDMDLRAQCEALWDQLDARGRMLMGKRGLAPKLRARNGFEVAAGS